MEFTSRKTSDLATYIGKQGTVRFGRITLRVTVLDAKVSYGKVRILVTPAPTDTDKPGSTWVDLASLQTEEKSK